MLVGFNYNNNEYFYSRDLTGNIIKIIDINGSDVVEYKYDAYGKALDIIGDNGIKYINSFLYKGYYYDFETNLYYCNSRFYDPEVLRWISIDEISYLDSENANGINLWCYCNNNPVMGYDPEGNWSWKSLHNGFVFSILLATTTVVSSCILSLSPIPLPTIMTLGCFAGSTASIAFPIFTLFFENTHYDRLNIESTIFPEYIDDFAGFEKNNLNNFNFGVASNCHQFTAEKYGDNKKIVSLDGKYEAIYDSNGNIVKDPRDIGTYNYFNPDKNKVLHGIFDVVPWIICGNSNDDTTTIFQRIWYMLRRN